MFKESFHDLEKRQSRRQEQGEVIYISDFNTAGDADVEKDARLWGKSLI